VPPLFEQEILKAISDKLSNKFQAVSFDIKSTLAAPKTLFAIPSPSEKEFPELFSYITKHLVESAGQARFITFLSERMIGTFRKHPCYSILRPYWGTFDKLTEDPASFLSWLTDLDSLPPYCERRLPELLLIATACQVEKEGLGEAELEDLISAICLLESNGKRQCYIPWNKLPKREGLLRLYFESLGIPPHQQIIAQSNRDFYLGKCFLHFSKEGLDKKFAEVAASSCAAEGEIVSNMLALRDKLYITPLSSAAMSFLYCLGLVYIVAQETPPTQYMGFTGREFAEQPALRKELLATACILLHSAEPVANGNWKETGRAIQSSLLTLATSSNNIDFIGTSEHLEGIVQEFKSRLKEYNEQDCKRLLSKTVKAALVLESSAALNEYVLPGGVAESLIALWQGCLQRLTSRSFSNEEWNNLWESVKCLASLNTQYKGAITILKNTQARSRIIDKVENNLHCADPIDDFFDLFATQLRELDFFLDTRVAKQLAIPLAKRYIELDEQLRDGLPPFSQDFWNARALAGLLPTLQVEEEFDRVFILIIDALSYLDWKLSRKEFSDLEEMVSIKDEYRLSPIPTYTPCALTALITGYHPSETGICDWIVRISQGDIINLQDTAHADILSKVSISLPKKNRLTLVHSQGNSLLTQLQACLADLRVIALPSTEHEKAIAQARECVYNLKPDTKVVAIYIADFDEFGHWYLRHNGWREYYSVQAGRIKNDLIKPILRRAQDYSEKTLIILTADHGKLTRYESRLLALALPEADGFQDCASTLDQYQPRHSLRHILGWIPETELDDVAYMLKSRFANNTDLLLFIGSEVKRILPYNCKTPFVNPNILALSRFGTKGQNIAHGGGSLSEVVVPAVRFEWKGD
jgi:hypothetical protein